MTEAERIEKESLQWPGKLELPNHSEKLQQEIERLQQLIKEKENIIIGLQKEIEKLLSLKHDPT